ncbi:hypothetical protein N7510_004109 [Penicillium lagena]|uniref:uncharacterized protein n=1 Tax=Penicillium lagena TaxID=94218 RepID=UPI002541F8A0|nr:uncharacterized protein N7510_004109 [Penicillium lagena]KAJ5620125.1 hypothetical protein N7510_004109 [Penicillium lagena]
MAGNEDVPDGTFYANVIDLDNNNSTVGRCVSSYSDKTDCASWGSTEAETYIHCYTDALSSPKPAVPSATGPFATHTFDNPTLTPTPAGRRRIKRVF